ncbi:hypothetical protein E2C01_091172 [Portunus trituberculatus]|uniref:Uncharacterized protein n=1 Tax=Portunus trituberculatus TaxID=210409 RepID=A0A5B7JNB8_PORTR|nr:hypothetical protein [Portunus trituberculatus]
MILCKRVGAPRSGQALSVKFGTILIWWWRGAITHLSPSPCQSAALVGGAAGDGMNLQEPPPRIA